jgi:T4-like virus Myoviridae tail sheath stabiliser
MTEKTLNECADPNPLEPSLNLDTPQPYCPECPDNLPSQKEVKFFEDLKKNMSNIGIGQSALCDPMQTGQIAGDMAKTPNRNTIYRYSKGIRGCDEAMIDMFKGIVVIDEKGTEFPVPIIWATQERAVQAILQPNVRKDATQVTDRLVLPMLAIYQTDLAYNQQRYVYHEALNYFRGKDGKPQSTIRERYNCDTVLGYSVGIPIDLSYQLTIWTAYIEDMNEILEQILLKFSPVAYIRVQGVWWEVMVKLTSIANNIDMEPGNQAIRIIKYQLNMTAETYLPQPITRQKAVLKTRVDFLDGIDQESITEVINTIETTVEELKP